MNEVQKKNRELPFLILIPIFILALAFIFDNVLIVVQDMRVNKITSNIVNECLTTTVSDYHERVKSLYEKSNINTELLEVEYDSGTLKIYNSYSYPSFFAKLIGVNHYRVETNVEAHLEGEEVVIIEVDPDEF